MNYLRIDAQREHYGADDVKTMTVAELIEYLSEFDDDLPVVLVHDNGYTYGGIRIGSISEDTYGEEEDE